jgi:hypothetical protein
MHVRTGRECTLRVQNSEISPRSPQESVQLLGSYSLEKMLPRPGSMYCSYYNTAID